MERPERCRDWGGVALPSVRTAIPALEIREGRYLARFARGPEELDAALKQYMTYRRDTIYAQASINYTQLVHKI
jgi:hypothetical protein